MESSSPEALVRARQRAEVIREVVELLQSEIGMVAQGRWEEFPDLKRQKVVLASKLRALVPVAGEAPPPEWARVAQLEGQSSLQLQSQIDLLGRQIAALQEVRQYGKECLSVSFAKYC